MFGEFSGNKLTHLGDADTFVKVSDEILSNVPGEKHQFLERTELFRSTTHLERPGSELVRSATDSSQWPLVPGDIRATRRPAEKKAFIL